MHGSKLHGQQPPVANNYFYWGKVNDISLKRCVIQATEDSGKEVPTVCQLHDKMWSKNNVEGWGMPPPKKIWKFGFLRLNLILKV